MDKHVVILGSINYDITASAERLPVRGVGNVSRICGIQWRGKPFRYDKCLPEDTGRKERGYEYPQVHWKLEGKLSLRPRGKRKPAGHLSH